MLHLSDQSLIVSRSAERNKAAVCLTEGWSTAQYNVELPAKTWRGGFQSIGGVINIDEEQDRPKHTALGNCSLNGKSKGERSIDSNILTA